MAPTTLKLDGCTVDLATRRVHGGQREQRLTVREVRLLSALTTPEGTDVDRDRLVLEVLGAGGSARTLDKTVFQLRAKIEGDPKNPRHLFTVHGVGYRFESDRGPAAFAPAPASPSAINLGDRTVDPRRLVVRGAGAEVALTALEGRLLMHLLAQGGRPVERDDLWRAVWQSTGPTSPRAIETAVRRLRGKIEPDPLHPVHLLSQRGSAYALVLERPATKPLTKGTLVACEVPDIDPLWTRPAQAVEGVLAEVRRRIERGVQAHGGTVLRADEATYVLVFSVAEAAARLACDLAAPDATRLAVGMHRGELRSIVDPVTGAESWGGSDLRLALHLCRLAMGGRVLCSDTTWRALDVPEISARTAEAATFGESQRAVVELARSTFHDRSTLRSSTPSRASAPTVTWVGREPALQRLQEALEQPGLVVLTAPGGMGKTTLALRALEVGGVEGTFVDLSTSKTANDLVAATARRLGVPLLSPDGAVEQIGRAIRSRGRHVLVLDNFEQLESAAVDVVVSWCAEAPEGVFLVTSRHALGVPSERRIELEALSDQDSIELFKRRASNWSPEDEPVVRELCRRLDGSPLAIEMAAARTDLLSPTDILARLSGRLDLLRGSDGAPRRFDSLRTTTAWSWELLEDQEQRFLRRASIFAGAFDVALAEAVVGPLGSPVVDIIRALRAKSLLARAEDGRSSRLLETVREFGAEQLRLADDAASVDAAYREAVARRGCAILERCDKEGELGAMAELRALGPDLQAAFASAVDHDFAVALRLGECLDRIVEKQGLTTGLVAALGRLVGRADGPANEVRARCLRGFWLLSFGGTAAAKEDVERCQAITTADAPTRADAELLIADYSMHRNQIDVAETHIVEALAHLPPGRRRAIALNLRGTIQYHRGQLPAAETSWLAGMSVFPTGTTSSVQARIQWRLAMTQLAQERSAEAQRNCSEALQAARELGDKKCEVSALFLLGGIAHAMGRTEQAYRMSQDAWALAREMGDRAQESTACGNIFMTELDLGRLAEAEAWLHRAIETTPDRTNAIRIAMMHGSLASARHERGDPAEAEALLQSSLGVVTAAGSPRLEGSLRHRLALVLLEAGRYEEAGKNARRAVECHDAAHDRAAARQARWLAAASEAGAGQIDETPFPRLAEEAARVGYPDVIVCVDLAWAFVELCAAERAFRSGQSEDGERGLASATSRVGHAEKRGPASERRPEGTPSPADRSCQSRILLRIVKARWNTALAHRQ